MRLPFVVWLLGGAVVAAFLLTGQYDLRQVNLLASVFGIVPARFTEGGASPVLPLFSHAFVHGGWPHVFMNMIGFLQAGPFIAQRLGAGRFLLLFFLSAIGGGAGYILINPDSVTPMVGASGAICGLFAAYFLSVRPSPRQALADPQVRNAIGVFLLVNVVLMGVLSALGMLPIAWEAHLGGFVVGGLVYLAIGPKRRAGPWD